MDLYAFPDPPADWLAHVPPAHLQQVRIALNNQFPGDQIYPQANNVFAALELTPLSSVRVIIIGQDPYHGPGEAHGLAFSKLGEHGRYTPSSLRNIFKELKATIPGWKEPISTDLTSWARQGVLLLNTVLTVTHRAPKSHSNIGWEIVVADILRAINHREQPVVFILWGKEAQKLMKQLDAARHYAICTSHPSGLSAHRGFLGSQCFVRANDWLKAHQPESPPIDWRVE